MYCEAGLYGDHQWPYRPEMQFSVYDLTIKNIQREGEAGSQGLSVIYDLLAGKQNPLLTFGPARELVMALGDQEQVIQPRDTNPQNGPLQPELTTTFANYEQLANLQPSQFLTLRIYQNSDAENILWEFALTARVVLHNLAESKREAALPPGAQGRQPDP